MRKIGWCLAALALVFNAALAGDKPLTDVERLTIAKKVTAATLDAERYWTVLPNGVVRHKNSGLACGADISTMPLVQLQTLTDSPVPDGHVDCRYATEDESAVYDVVAFSPGKALSGQDAFDAHRKALLAVHPDAQSVMTFPVLDYSDAYGEAFVITAGGKRRLSFLCASAVHEWVIVVRFTAAPLPPQADEAMTKTIAHWLSAYPQAVLYRAMRGVYVKQLNKPDPKDGF